MVDVAGVSEEIDKPEDVLMPAAVAWWRHHPTQHPGVARVALAVVVRVPDEVGRQHVITVDRRLEAGLTAHQRQPGDPQRSPALDILQASDSEPDQSVSPQDPQTDPQDPQDASDHGRPFLFEDV